MADWYVVLYGPDIAAGEPAAESSDPNDRDVVLKGCCMTPVCLLSR